MTRAVISRPRHHAGLFAVNCLCFECFKYFNCFASDFPNKHLFVARTQLTTSGFSCLAFSPAVTEELVRRAVVSARGDRDEGKRVGVAGFGVYIFN